jgi:small subunit ribosomal protein S9
LAEEAKPEEGKKEEKAKKAKKAEKAEKAKPAEPEAKESKPEAKEEAKPEAAVDGAAEAKAASKPKAKAKAKKTYFWGTGRRKTAVARVRIRPGSGLFQVNGKELKEYFVIERLRAHASAPLTATSTAGKVDVFVNVHGGGPTGQAGATIMGVARALMKMDEGLSPALRAKGFLTRDARKVERKKYGRRGARRSFQFSKR